MARNVADSDITNAELRQWLRDYRRGRSKNDIERRELNDPYSHGKRMSRLWREVLGVETEHEHPAITEVHRLIAICDDNMIQHESRYA